MEVTEDNETNNDGSPVGDGIRDPQAVLDALDRAKSDAKKYRERLEEFETTNKALQDRIAELEGEGGIGKYKKQLIDISAKKELVSKGVKDVDRILGLLDRDSFDLDDDGKLVGFNESLNSLKERLPELFDDKKRVAGGADAFSNEAPKPKLSSTEAQVRRIFSH
jgi:hypothetical protein